MVKKYCLMLLTFLSITSNLLAADWPQFQSDAARTGRTADQVSPDFRLRWAWLGNSNIIRNKLSNTAWTGPRLAPGAVIGDSVSLPASVPFTFSSLAQPVVFNNAVFIADQEGTVYALSVADGSTLWSSPNPGGAIASVACASGKVITGSISGAIRLFDATTGAAAGVVTSDGPITSAPAILNGKAYVGSLDRSVYCVDIASGSLAWKSPDLGSGIAGGIAVDANAVYAGAENMVFSKLNISTGAIMLQKKVSGQSFSLEWPVVFNGKVYIESAPIVAIGSEYVGEEVMSGATSVDNEQDRWLQFLSGQGGFSGASPDWKHLTVLNTSDFSEPFVVPDGPFEGCGTPPEPPVVDNQDRIIAYFKTKYVTFAKPSAFGTAYSIDLSAINQATGRRIQINNGTPNHDWYTWETDNLYGLACGGNILYMRQEFRGTIIMDLSNSTSKLVAVTYGDQDGGGFWNADIIWRGYSSAGIRPPASAHPQVAGRAAPSISGNAIFFVEDFAVVCAEHHQ